MTGRDGRGDGDGQEGGVGRSRDGDETATDGGEGSETVDPEPETDADPESGSEGDRDDAGTGPDSDSDHDLDADAVGLVRDDGVATVTLRNEGMRNAITGAVARGLIEAFEALEGTDTRCVVLTGRGGTFSAGGDVNAMTELQAGGWTLDEAVRHVDRVLGRAVRSVHDCEFPTVAAVEGSAVGAGAALAIACDVQLLADDARIGFGFRRVGLAVDSGTSYLLPRLVGDNVAKELVFTGELLDADRAVEIGVVNRAYPADGFDERVAEFVERVASGPTVALRTSKRLLDAGHDATLAEAVANEAAAQAAVFETEDHAEGVSSFLEGREPAFEGR